MGEAPPFTAESVTLNRAHRFLRYIEMHYSILYTFFDTHIECTQYFPILQRTSNISNVIMWTLVPIPNMVSYKDHLRLLLKHASA